MKKRLLLLPLIVGLGISQYVDAQNDKPFVHCLVLDKTMSMIGHVDKTMSMIGHRGKNIWADVQKYCYDWVEGVDRNSTVLFFTYDKELYGPQVFVINSDTDRDKVKEAIKNVVVDGRLTWIASNLKKVVEYAFNNYPDNKKRIYLITDGVEEQPGSDFPGVLRDFDGRCSEYDHLFYVDLNGKADSVIIDAIKGSEHADLGKGFLKFIPIKPVFPQMEYLIGKTKQLEQHFTVSKSDIPEELSFNVKIDSIVNVGEGGGVANVNISPSNVSFGRMTKLEDGKYKVIFDISFINNSARECDIVVKIDSTPIKVGENEFQFASESDFCIQVRKAKAIVEVLDDGWDD